MHTNLEHSLSVISVRIEEAGKGSSAAQNELAEIFASNQIIPEDKQLATFWRNLSEESKHYRSTARIRNRNLSRPLNFISVEDEYSREVNITPLFAIKEAVTKSLNRVEEHRKRTTYTYIVTIKSFDSSKELLALMGARAVFGWTSSEARSNFASLPYELKDMSSKEEALSVIEELKKSGVTAEFKMLNGLGEDVTKGTWKAASEKSTEKESDEASEGFDFKGFLLEFLEEQDMEFEEYFDDIDDFKNFLRYLLKDSDVDFEDFWREMVLDEFGFVNPGKEQKEIMYRDLAEEVRKAKEEKSKKGKKRSSRKNK